MSVDTTTRKVAFSSTQVADYAFTFRALTSAPSDIKVKVTTSGTTSDLTYTTDYTVAVNSNGVGGTVTLVTTYGTATHTITIYRDTTNKQESDYNDYNQFPSDTLETDLDRRTMLAQEIEEDVSRCAQVSVASTITSLTLPEPSAGKCWVWTGNTLANSTYAADSIGTIAVAAATAATTAQTAAETAETNAEAAETAATAATLAAQSYANIAIVTDSYATNALSYSNLASTSAGLSLSSSVTALTYSNTATTQATVSASHAVTALTRANTATTQAVISASEAVTSLAGAVSSASHSVTALTYSNTATTASATAVAAAATSVAAGTSATASVVVATAATLAAQAAETGAVAAATSATASLAASTAATLASQSEAATSLSYANIAITTDSYSTNALTYSNLAQTASALAVVAATSATASLVAATAATLAAQSYATNAATSATQAAASGASLSLNNITATAVGANLIPTSATIDIGAVAAASRFATIYANTSSCLGFVMSNASTGVGKVLTCSAAGIAAWATPSVTKVGTPANDQVGVWTGDGTIEGRATAVITTEGVVTLSGNSGARGFKDTPAQTITAAATTKVVLNAESYDIQGEFDSTTNSRFTATVAGYYAVNASVIWITPSNDENFNLYIYKNNSSINEVQGMSSSSGQSYSQVASDVIYLAVNDYLEIFVTNGDTANRDIYYGSHYTYLSVNKIR